MASKVGDCDPDYRVIAPNFRRVKGTRLFRSSKLDNIDESGIEHLKKLDISTVLDLRSPEGWEDTATQGQISYIDTCYEALSVTYSSWTQNIANMMRKSSRRDAHFQYKVNY